MLDRLTRSWGGLAHRGTELARRRADGLDGRGRRHRAGDRARPASLDNIRAVLVSVDGKPQIAHYRHGFTANDHEHVWSVTKSVVATLIGMAIHQGLIKGLDQPLGSLLPVHRKAMTPAVAAATLRQLMSMSAGFADEEPSHELYQSSYTDSGDYVDLLLERGSLQDPGKTFLYSNISADLVVAVLAAALKRADGTHPRSVLDYARAELFDPLGIETRPAYTEPFTMPVSAQFRAAGFGWTTDPDGLANGAYGLRLTAPDMIKIGELYLDRGVWNGRRLLPETWVDEVSRPSKLEPTYGLLWWIYSTDGGDDGPVFAASGVYGQRIIVAPKQGVVIVTLTTTPDGVTVDDVDVNAMLVKAVRPALR